jgi:3'-5' exonuclease
MSSEETGAPLGAPTAYLVLDTESIPDGRLLAKVKYPAEDLSPDDAIARAQMEARSASWNQSDFLPVSFQIPVAICIIRVGQDYRLQNITSLDAPHFQPGEIVKKFWKGVTDLWSQQDQKRTVRAQLVTFNGRSFDLPLLEMAAYRYGCSCGASYFQLSRKRYELTQLDLHEWMSNFGAWRMTGGLNLLSKILGKPGKMDTAGDQVYALYQAGKFQEINDYCMFDTLDTYFVFLRTRVIRGDIPLDQEQELVKEAKQFLVDRQTTLPALEKYLANWGDWAPWP